MFRFKQKERQTKDLDGQWIFNRVEYLEGEQVHEFAQNNKLCLPSFT